MLRNSLKNKEGLLSDKGVDTIKSFLDIVNNKSPRARKIIEDRVERNYKYKQYDENGIGVKGTEKDPKIYYEEYLNTYFDALTREQIKYNPSVGETLTEFMVPFVRKLYPKYQRGKKYSTETGKDLYNMMRDFHKSSEKGEVVEAAVELAKEGPKMEVGEGIVESKEREIRLVTGKEVSKELKKIEPGIKEDVIKIFDLKNSVNSKKSYGGTSFENIKKMIKKYKNA